MSFYQNIAISHKYHNRRFENQLEYAQFAIGKLEKTGCFKHF